MKKCVIAATIAAVCITPVVHATVFLNEIVVNPPGGSDDTNEYIELMGTPGKKLDGYAIACMNGGVTKYFPYLSLPSSATADMEIDEFFSLDGLSLGANGILVISVGEASDHLKLLDDANFQTWGSLWNGGLDTPGKLNNDGSMTVMLVRNRPGRTQADPTNLAGLRWGKDINHDGEIIRPVEDPNAPGTPKDQFGNGAIDKGDFNSNGVQTLDLRGFLTLEDVSDDLEIVDEFSLENDRGWEQDIDSRDVDSNSLLAGLPPRKVHALDDAQGFNPDALTRVDYRTKGDGYTPALGAIGALPNGNNWQDTATEQWIRGETYEGFDDEFNSVFLYDNVANANADAIQPYETNVPLWLDDGMGDDYDFSSPGTYELMPGRINPLAVTFVPGDSDRDGDCDTDDIAKIAAVFGDDDWIFSNSFAATPEGKDGDPAMQTRPWDVDATGDNGIEASDLQWTLNFQGDTTGRIVGVQYDSETPSATGVILNSNAGTACTITATANVLSGRPLNDLRFGDIIELTVAGQVTSGANMVAGQQNGIMQFVNDVVVSAEGVLDVVSIVPQGSFATTRTEIQETIGTNGTLSVNTINGYSTSFAAGLTAADPLYVVSMRVVGAGSADVDVLPAAMPKFAASTPEGVKLGHTDEYGNPAASTYPAAISVMGAAPGDEDGDGDVTLADYVAFPTCMTGPGATATPTCTVFDFDFDTDVDLDDYATFMMLIAE